MGSVNIHAFSPSRLTDIYANFQLSQEIFFVTGYLRQVGVPIFFCRNFKGELCLNCVQNLLDRICSPATIPHVFDSLLAPNL